MTVLLEIREVYKRYGLKELLVGASAVITDQHNVGLIGRNGAGKSTLCRILLDEESVEAGEVIKHPTLRLGYLRQHDPFLPEETVLDFLQRDSEQSDWKCAEVAAEFEIKNERLEQPVAELSGGWQTRVKLAALLLHEPNMLLLDEPTNFLDLRTQLLLEDFLKSFRGACLIVSHDRAFLKATCDRTLDLTRGRLTMFTGDVDKFMEYQQQRREHDLRVNASVLAKRRQLETFINKNRANANTASQARSKAKQLERLDLIEIEGAESEVRFRLPEIDIRKGSALRCHDLSIGYPSFEVASDVQLEIDHGTRTAVVGDNGQGKTTLLRTLTDSLPPLSGSLRWGYGCEIGVYAQHVYSSLPSELTVVEFLQHQSAPDISSQQVLNMAGCFLFQGDDVQKKIQVLSGGERARLCLAGLMLGKHNVLVLDEPGNHLDVETIEALVEALDAFPGTVIFTSHDRYFLKRVATGVIEVGGGRVASYPSSYDDYLYRINKEVADDAALRHAKEKDGKQQKASSVVSRDDRKQLAKRQYEMQKEVKSLERKMGGFEQRRKQFEDQLLATTSQVEVDRILGAIDAVNEKLEPVESRWIELNEQLEEIAQQLAD